MAPDRGSGQQSDGRLGPSGPNECLNTLGINPPAYPITDAGGAAHAHQVRTDRRQTDDIVGPE
jgi:hypothetical protein